MDILPAIDLIDGQCVRLIQGQYDKKITYKDDPVAQANEFYDTGARWLHMVDLDEAKQGKSVNAEVVANITKEVPMTVELGGGIRDEAAIVSMLDAGVKVVYEADRDMNVWHELELLLTRVASDGKVWGAQERVDRTAALNMITRWAAEYFGKYSFETPNGSGCKCS